MIQEEPVSFSSCHGLFSLLMRQCKWQVRWFPWWLWDEYSNRMRDADHVLGSSASTVLLSGYVLHSTVVPGLTTQQSSQFRDSSVSIVTRLRAARPGFDCGQDLRHRITGPGAHPTSYAMRRGGKAVGEWSWPLVTMLRMHERISSLPLIPCRDN
jgi:hypothetical protein